MDAYTSNEYKLYISDALYSAVLLIATGPLLQTFMLELGLSEQLVSRVVSVFQVVQGSVMILCASLTEKIKNVPKACAMLMLNPFAILAVILFFSMREGTGRLSAACIAMLIGGCITNFALGFYNVLTYKRPYHIIRMSEYGRVTANGSVIIGVFGMLVSFLLTFCLGRFPYFDVIRIFAMGGVVMIFAASAIGCTYKKVESAQSVMKPKGEKINLFRYKPFYLLLFPNLVRGIGAGIFSVSVTIGYYFDVLNSATSGYINIAVYVATILGGVVYTRIAKRWNNGKVILLSGLATVATLPLMLVGKNPGVFIAGYTVSYLLINVFGMAIPVSVTEFVDYHVMGRYTAWRMMLQTIGTAIGGFLTPILLSSIGGISTLLLAGVLQLITGIGYYAYLQSGSKQETADAVATGQKSAVSTTKETAGGT